MTYPYVEASATSTDSDRSGTTLSMNIPAGVNAGEVLFASLTADNSAAGQVSFPAGWITVYDDTASKTVSSVTSVVAGFAAYKLADGSETGTLSVTVPNESCCGIMYRISGAANPTHEPPVVGTRQVTNTVGQFWGHMVWGKQKATNDFLCFSFLHRPDIASVIQKYPDNSTGNGNIQGTSSQMWYAHRDIRGPGEVSGAWDVSVNLVGINFTVMFYPKVRWVASADGVYPYVRCAAVTTDVGRVASTTFDVNYPKIIRPGDILVAFVGVSNSGVASVVWPSGWTEWWNGWGSYVSGFGSIHTANTAAWRVADGTEGQKFRIETTAQNPTCAICVSVGGSDDTTVNPPEGSEGAHTSSGGTNYYLIFTGITTEDEDNWPLNFATNFERHLITNSDVNPPTAGVYLQVSWRIEYTDDNSTRGTSAVGSTSFSGFNGTGFIYPGSFDTDVNWWYQGRYSSGRGGTQ